MTRLKADRTLLTTYYTLMTNKQKFELYTNKI